MQMSKRVPIPLESGPKFISNFKIFQNMVKLFYTF
jgi:hypothetical protein